ncbi:MAG TPA: hypothetical protein DIT88_00625, partial [Planctomycetaceae bacterium]|nr:hypothetical protein [Planctomycetaceae bacterium]
MMSIVTFMRDGPNRGFIPPNGPMTLRYCVACILISPDCRQPPKLLQRLKNRVSQPFTANSQTLCFKVNNMANSGGDTGLMLLDMLTPQVR